MATPDEGPTDEPGGSTRRTVLAAAGLVGAGGLLQPTAGRVSDADEAGAGERDAVADSPVTAGSVAGTETPVGDGSDWPQHNANAGNTAHLPDGVAPTGDVSEAWRYRNDRYHEGVAVVDGTVYVGGKSLAAVDAGTGEERWQFRPEPPDLPDDQEGDTPEFGTPAVGDGQVYASVGFGVYDGGVPGEMLVAVDAGTGEEGWRYDPTDSEALSAPTVYSETQEPETADDGRADGGTAGGGTIYTRDGDTVHALAPNGSVRWTQSVDDGGSTYNPVPVAGGSVFVPGTDGVRALDAGSGDAAWTALDGEDFSRGTAAVVADGRLYVGRLDDAAATLVALDADTGDERWRTAWRGARPSLSIGAVSADSVYVQTDAVDADVVAVDADDGSERWRTTVEQPERSEYPTEDLALVGGRLYTGSVCLDPADGSIRWTHPLAVTGGGWWLGAVAGGRVYVLGEQVVVLEGTTGGGGGETTTECRTTNRGQG